MRIISELFANRVLWVGLCAWFIAQALKVVFTALIEKKWDLGRLFGLGGMPSSHSSVVCALGMAVGMSRGFYSVEFAICFMLAMVVMTDAAGVRRAAGQQAVVLNQLIKNMLPGGNQRLKELLGHTPFEVLVGALLGILIGILMM